MAAENNGKQLSWPMVVLILLSGAGNFWATKDGAGANRAEIDTVLRQLGEISAIVKDLKELLNKTSK